MRCITWQGRTFRFQRMAGRQAGEALDWAVSCGFEFIGTMSCVEVTTWEFDARCVTWLAELIE